MLYAISYNAETWSSLLVGDEGFIGPSRKLFCLCETPKIMLHTQGVWADPVVHLLLLKSSMVESINKAVQLYLHSVPRVSH